MSNQLLGVNQLLVVTPNHWPTNFFHCFSSWALHEPLVRMMEKALFSWFSIAHAFTGRNTHQEREREREREEKIVRLVSRLFVFLVRRFPFPVSPIATWSMTSYSTTKLAKKVLRKVLSSSFKTSFDVCILYLIQRKLFIRNGHVLWMVPIVFHSSNQFFIWFSKSWSSWAKRHFQEGLCGSSKNYLSIVWVLVIIFEWIYLNDIWSFHFTVT